MSSQITTTFLIGGSEVEASVRVSALSGAVYFAKCDAVCNTPVLIGSYAGGDRHLFVELDMPNGTKVVALTGEEGFVHGKKATIELLKPLRTGQRIGVMVDTPTCKTKSCEVVVSEMTEMGCEIKNETQTAGTLTGELVCMAKDLYRMVFDGNGGKYAGILVQEDCIYCGGSLPKTDGGGTGGGGGVDPTDGTDITGNGLIGQYHNYVETNGVKQYNFDGPTVNRLDAFLSPNPQSGIGENMFAVRWDGKIKGPVSGVVNFEVDHDDGVRVWINGVSVLDAWTTDGIHTFSYTMVENRLYDIRVEYNQYFGAAWLRFYWEYAGQAKVIVPTAYLIG